MLSCTSQDGTTASHFEIFGKPCTSVELNGESYAVIGVMADTATFPDERTEAWIPLTFTREQLQSRDNFWLKVVGRLKDNVSLAQAQQAMSTLANRLATRYPDLLADHGIELVPLQQDTVGDSRPTLLLLQGTVACMLLIATLNVANLLLLALVIRTEGDPSLLVGSLRKVISEIDASLPLYRVRSWAEEISDSIGERRLDVCLVGGFALGALFLSSLGLYGIVSYNVLQRNREVGIRMALGARRADVIRLIMWDGIRMVLAGALIGVLGSLGIAHLLQGLLYQVAPNDPVTLIGVVLLLCGVALVANYLPAQRAASIDPVRSLSE